MTFEKTEQKWVKKRVIHNYCPCKELRRTNIFFPWLPIMKKTQNWLDRPIGLIYGDMQISDAMQTRLQDHPFIEFINKIQMDIANVSISCTSLFHNTSPCFPKYVTMRDIVSNYIYPNTLQVIRITGADIKRCPRTLGFLFHITCRWIHHRKPYLPRTKAATL